MIGNRYSEYTSKVINPVEKKFNFKDINHSVNVKTPIKLNYGNIKERYSSAKTFSTNPTCMRKHLPSATEILYNITKELKIKPTVVTRDDKRNILVKWSFGKFEVKLVIVSKRNRCVAELSIGDDRYDIGLTKYSHSLYYDWRRDGVSLEWKDSTQDLVVAVKEYIQSAEIHNNRDNQFFIQNLQNFKKIIPEHFHVKYPSEAIEVKQPTSSRHKIVNRSDIETPIDNIGVKYILPRDVIHDSQVTLHIYSTIESKYILRAYIDNIPHNSIVFVFDSLGLYNLDKVSTMKKILNILAITRQNINEPSNRLINRRMYFDAVIAMMRTEKILKEFDLVPANIYSEELGHTMYEEKVYVHR